MGEWVTVNKVFSFEVQARKAAQVITVTESRLSSASQGVNYDIETEVIQSTDGWRIRWRKVLANQNSGCSQCGSCQSQSEQSKTELQPGKVLQFKPRPKVEKEKKT